MDLAGAVQDDYILGTGDEIIIVLQGGTNDVVKQLINRWLCLTL